MCRRKLTRHVSQVACGSLFFYMVHVIEHVINLTGFCSLFALFRCLQSSLCLSKSDTIQTFSTCDTLLPKPQSESGSSLRSSAICRVVGSGSWEQSLPRRTACVNDWQQPGASLRCLYETWEHSDRGRGICIWVMNVYLYVVVLLFHYPTLLPGLAALCCAVLYKNTILCVICRCSSQCCCKNRSCRVCTILHLDYNTIRFCAIWGLNLLQHGLNCKASLVQFEGDAIMFDQIPKLESCAARCALRSRSACVCLTQLLWLQLFHSDWCGPLSPLSSIYLLLSATSHPLRVFNLNPNMNCWLFEDFKY